MAMSSERGKREKVAGAASDPAAPLPLPHLNLHVLLALVEGDLHGYAIIKKIGEITGGQTTPSTGSLYLAMVRLEESGLIQETHDRPESHTDDSRRRYYRLTDLGRQVLEAETARLARLVGLAREWSVLDDQAAHATPRGSRSSK
jgi:DNA-binding PadR family transcriptional regulator